MKNVHCHQDIELMRAVAIAVFNDLQTKNPTPAAPAAPAVPAPSAPSPTPSTPPAASPAPSCSDYLDCSGQPLCHGSSVASCRDLNDLRQEFEERFKQIQLSQKDIYFERAEIRDGVLVLHRNDKHTLKVNLPNGMNNVVISATLDGVNLVLQKQNGDQITADLSALIQGGSGTVHTDGSSITGDGSASNPLSAQTGVESFSNVGDKIVLTLHNGQRYEVNGSTGSSGASGSSGSASGSGLNLQASSALPHSNQGTELPTTLIGSREMLLAKPDKWVEITLEGVTYLMPCFAKA